MFIRMWSFHVNLLFFREQQRIVPISFFQPLISQLPKLRIGISAMIIHVFVSRFTTQMYAQPLYIHVKYMLSLFLKLSNG